MNVNDLKELDDIWYKTYSYLAAQVAENYSGEPRTLLELGPFSGGIAPELAKIYPGLAITIADESIDVLEYTRQKLAASGLADARFELTDFDRLDFGKDKFALIVFRGILFYLDTNPHLLEGIFSLLDKGGMAFLGGGHGKGVPADILKQIGPSLRRLHRRLGGRIVSVSELEDTIRKAGLAEHCRIIETGGVWIKMRN
jgi:ubiquinone/menaquinone biosynthesis C-methylase UbiE